MYNLDPILFFHILFNYCKYLYTSPLKSFIVIN